MPIRWRLAGGSAVLTFVILACFAAIVGVLTGRQVRGQLSDEMRSQIPSLTLRLMGRVRLTGDTVVCDNLSDLVAAEHGQLRLFSDGQLVCTQDGAVYGGVPQPAFSARHSRSSYQQFGYLVMAREAQVPPGPELTLLYARPLSEVDHTLARVQFFLLLGVLGGTVLALLAGLATAQRAMRPVVSLTETAREIERTRDPSLRVPHPEAQDEVAELATTLEDMLGALDDARSETEATLQRQREFVADASHELRTPLTSVLANLELLAEELDGEQAESAQAALRSTRRMRRLVGDLLLLARADAKRGPRQRPTDLAGVLTEAAAELGPVAEGHDLSVQARPAVVAGSPDDLHRMVLNLIENAVQHTPPGTHIRAGTDTQQGAAVLVVEDDGPGIAPELEQRVFERFVRGSGDGGRGSGLGLAIVRAVVESHGGTVSLGHGTDGRGTRFVIKLPGDSQPPPGRVAPHTSTTTGSTIGRRRSRS